MDLRIDEYQPALIQMRESTYEQEGLLYLLESDVQRIPFVPEFLCNHDDEDSRDEHGSRVCPVCLDSWLCDWFVWLPADSPVLFG